MQAHMQMSCGPFSAYRFFSNITQAAPPQPLSKKTQFPLLRTQKSQEKFKPLSCTKIPVLCFCVLIKLRVYAYAQSVTKKKRCKTNGHNPQPMDHAGWEIKIGIPAKPGKHQKREEECWFVQWVPMD